MLQFRVPLSKIIYKNASIQSTFAFKKSNISSLNILQQKISSMLSSSTENDVISGTKLIVILIAIKTILKRYYIEYSINSYISIGVTPIISIEFYE